MSNKKSIKDLFLNDFDLTKTHRIVDLEMGDFFISSVGENKWMFRVNSKYPNNNMDIERLYVRIMKDVAVSSNGLVLVHKEKNK